MATTLAVGARRREAAGSGGVLWGLVGLFFLSGGCGLVYQTLWVRLLSLAFGVTVFAVTVVLASFMAGLAAGSFVGGRVAARTTRPLLVYGVVEIAIGLVALATPVAFQAFQAVYPLVAAPLGDDEAVLFPIRVTLAFVLLAIPTGLMGATLPIIVQSSLARSTDLAGRIGLLYAANTFGAIAGTLLAGFWLIGDLGISRSIQLAAAVNGIVGLAAILMQRRGGAGEQRLHEAAADVDGTPFSSTARRVALIGYGLSGACSFAYEVVWTRMLALVLDTSIYAFVTMLAMVLVGIAVGSAAVTPLVKRRWNWPLIFAGLQLLIAAAGLWAIWAVPSLRGARQLLEKSAWLAWIVSSPTWSNFVVAAMMLLPATLLIGATFPIAARIYTSGVGRSSERLGEIYAVNVLGAVVGSMLGGFVLLPLFGTQTSLLILSAVSVAIAATLALGAERPRLPARSAFVVAGALGLLGLWMAKPDLYRSLQRARFADTRIIYFQEGLETTVTVYDDRRGVRNLYTNSRFQSQTTPGLVSYHRQLAHLPLLVKPAARDVLIVGLGAGTTAGAILQHAGTRVEAVELSDAVVGGVRHFAATNYDALNDPNLSVKIGDGRNHLLTTRARYDLITADSIQPQEAGSTNLYSVEYYRLARNALNPGGVVAQWVAPYDEYQHRTMIRSFLSVFPHVTLWLGADLLIGSQEPITLDLAETARRFEPAGSAAALAEAGLDGPESAARAFVASRDELEAYVGDGPILSDDRPLLEYFRSLPAQGKGDPPDRSRFSRDPSKITAR